MKVLGLNFGVTTSSLLSGPIKSVESAIPVKNPRGDYVLRSRIMLPIGSWSQAVLETNPCITLLYDGISCAHTEYGSVDGAMEIMWCPSLGAGKLCMPSRPLHLPFIPFP